MKIDLPLIENRKRRVDFDGGYRIEVEKVYLDTYDGYCCMCRVGYHLVPLENYNCECECTFLYINYQDRYI